MRIVKSIAWLCFIGALAVFGIMRMWTLPVLAEMSDGLPIFDLMPLGYSFDEARALLSALGTDGIAFYRGSQQMLDQLYPVFYGTALVLGLYLFAPVKWGRWRLAVALLGLPAPIYDYLENSMVKFMLFLGPNNINQQIVGWASARTLTKSLSISLALLVLIVLIIYWAVRKFPYKPRTNP